MHNQKEELIQLRLSQAKESITDVEFLIENNRLNLAINRIYYGMFYSLLALALRYDFKTSKHAQLIGWFNREFIKANIIDRKFSKMVQRAFHARTDGDYGLFIEFEYKEVLERYEELKFFIKEIERFLNADLNYK